MAKSYAAINLMATTARGVEVFDIEDHPDASFENCLDDFLTCLRDIDDDEVRFYQILPAGTDGEWEELDAQYGIKTVAGPTASAVKSARVRAQTLSAYGKKLKRIAEHLTGITGLWPNYKDNVFGACHAPNTSFSRLDGDCGQVVLLEESSSSWTIESYTVFDSFDEYMDWYNNQLDDYGKGHYLHYGDCSLAYRAAKNLGWVGDCDDDPT